MESTVPEGSPVSAAAGAKETGGRFEYIAAFLLPFHPVFGVLALIGLSARGGHVWRNLRQQRSDMILWGVLAVAGIVSIFGAYDKTQGVLNFFVPFLFIWLYGLGRWAIQSPTRFLEAMLRGTAVLALIMIVGRLFLIDLRIGDFIILGRFNHRGNVLGMHSNGLAMVLEAGVIGGLGLLVVAKTARQRVLAAAIAILSLIATGITLSRGAMVGIGAGAAALGLLMSPRVLLALGVGATGVLGLSARIRTRAFSIFELDRHDARFGIWEGSWRMLKDHLLFGVGPGNFGRVYPNYSLPHLSSFRSAHNNYLFFTVAWGFVGGILFFGWQAWVMIRSLLRGLSSQQKIMWAILIAFGAHVLFDDLMTAYAGLLLGCLENPAYSKGYSPGRPAIAEPGN